jgi:hypothetical protein
MEFFSDNPTDKWTCNEVCDYYRSKNKDKDQSLGEILCEIKKDLKTNLSDPNLNGQIANILNNWNVSIKVVSQESIVQLQTVKGRCFFTFKLFEFSCLRSAGSGGGTGYVPFLNIKQLVC